jgi:curved DNA-binding protein CbpA
MIDCFALLDQPRAPWLDLEKLKEAFHQKTLHAHPDVQTTRPDSKATDETFTSLNQAYQVLQDPKKRLHHLLSLEGAAPSSTDQTVPSHFHDLFLAIGALTRRVNLLLEKIQASSNTLSRSLLKSQTLQAQSETREVREQIRNMSEAALDQLRQINTAWAKNPAEQIESLSNLYFAFAYLSRWSTQLDEMTFQLSLH